MCVYVKRPSLQFGVDHLLACMWAESVHIFLNSVAYDAGSWQLVLIYSLAELEEALVRPGQNRQGKTT